MDVFDPRGQPGTLAVFGGEPALPRPLARHWPVAGEREVALVQELVVDGTWFEIVGKRTEELESGLAAFHDLPHGVAVSSGLDALNICLRALGAGPGDEVIMPGYTCVANAIAALQANTVPVFVDIDGSTWCLDADSFETAITPRTKAVMAVHFAGNVADMDAICQIARKHGVAVIEDAALALGATRFGRSVGSWGDLAILSFGEDKPMTAGRGAMILTRDDRLAAICRALRDRGRESKEFYGNFQQKLGGNFYMGELLAAVLLGQFERYPEQIATLEPNARRLFSALATTDGLRIVSQVYPGQRNVVNMAMLRFDCAHLGVNKYTIVRALKAEGVSCSEGYNEPLNRHTVMNSPLVRACPVGCPRGRGGSVDYSAQVLPVSEDACQNNVWIWQSTLMCNENDIDGIAEACRKVVAQCDSLRLAGQDHPHASGKAPIVPKG